MDTEETATPETGTVDAPVSAMDSVLAEFESGTEQPDAMDEVLSELTEKPSEDGDADEAAGNDEDDAVTAEVEEPAADPTHKVTVNGEELEVPLSELVKGYSREQDYTSKTMALGEERKQLEAQKATLGTTVRTEYASKLTETVTLFEQLDPILSEARTMTQADWQRLEATDPAGFISATKAVQARLALVEQGRAEIAQIQQQAAETEARAIEEERADRMNETAAKIIEQNPELADETTFKLHATNTMNYLREAGFSNDEIADAFDVRVAKMADSARKWDAQEKAKAELAGKKDGPKPGVKTLQSDALPRSATPKRLRANATRDERVKHVLNQFFEGS